MTIPHATSLAVWDTPSPSSATHEVRGQSPVPNARRPALGGRVIEVRDGKPVKSWARARSPMRHGRKPRACTGPASTWRAAQARTSARLERELRRRRLKLPHEGRRFALFLRHRRRTGPFGLSESRRQRKPRRPSPTPRRADLFAPSPMRRARRAPASPKANFPSW